MGSCLLVVVFLLVGFFVEVDPLVVLSVDFFGVAGGGGEGFGLMGLERVGGGLQVEFVGCEVSLV